MKEDDLLLEWYRNLHQERWERSRRTWITVSIFMAGSFLLLVEAITNRADLTPTGLSLLMMCAVALIVVSGIIQISTLKLNRFALDWIIKLEKDWNFGGPQIRHEEEEKALLFKIRAKFWYGLFLSLGFLYVLAWFLLIS